MKNNTKSKTPTKILPSLSGQSGLAVLGTVILLLIIVGLLGVMSSRVTILETKMVFNLQDKQRSLLAADSAALYGWDQENSNLDTNIKNIVNNGTHAGYYVLGSKISTGAKKSFDWNAIKNVTTWPWDDSNKRFVLPAQLGGASNPMKLHINPQYTLGIHNATMRKGTAGYKCIPISIIGAGKGGMEVTRTLIELKAVPKSGCFRDKIK